MKQNIEIVDYLPQKINSKELKQDIHWYKHWTLKIETYYFSYRQKTRLLKDKKDNSDCCQIIQCQETMQ